MVNVGSINFLGPSAQSISRSRQIWACSDPALKIGEFRNQNAGGQHAKPALTTISNNSMWLSQSAYTDTVYRDFVAINLIFLTYDMLYLNNSVFSFIITVWKTVAPTIFICLPICLPLKRPEEKRGLYFNIVNLSIVNKTLAQFLIKWYK